ncbi:hypothetical protein [Nocardioides houyundeii]|uniref:hypothetical protein n=1 Tax=Nocardioides houyundeii TaxID=2045452 RepID=UPI00131569FF|nr:hypothetical protein [Nocardioides houyundeii]
MGRIAVEGTPAFAWSYDSGTYRARRLIDEEIGEAATRLATISVPPRLDVHYISHFHEDHVKGLPTLANVFEVRRIVAPLLEPWERLAQLVTHPSPSYFAVSLAADPATVLSGLAGTVILVEPGGDPLVPPPEAPVETVDDLPGIAPEFGAGVHEKSGADATVKLLSGGRPIWILAPYVPAVLRDERPRFVTELAKLWQVSEDAVEKRLADPQEFTSLVGTRKQRTDIRQAYLAALRAAGLPSDQNWTSLLLYSGPYGSQRRWRSRWWHDLWDDSTLADLREGSPWGSHADWLHTGDACLGQSSIRDEVTAHYGSWLGSLGTLQAPHHGSGGNWSPDLRRWLGAGANVVVPGVPGFKGWPLPALSLQRDVAASGWSLVQVTDEPGSRFSDTWTLSTG